jgi:hypothetical protein
MAQGWTIDATGHTITFFEAPANGATIAVGEFPVTATGATDVWARGAWSEANGYPSEVEFYNDRLIFAGTRAQPQSEWFSKSGSYVDFGRSSPIVDDDTIAVTLNARQQNRIVELVPLDKLITMTTGGEWRTDGGQDNVLTPSTISFQPQSYNGSARVPALVIGNTCLYIQNRGYVVRDLAYQFDVDGYTGTDLTVFSSHLTEGKPIAEWDYQQTPFSTAWIVREDGVLLALTYMREQQVVGWTPMEIDGFVESVCVVPEETEDAVYIAVRRVVGGVEKHYVERLATRLIPDVRKAKFLDSFLTYDGTNTGATTMTATPITDWSVGERVTLTASVATFAPGDLQDIVVLGYLPGTNARLRIVEYTSSTVVVAELDTPVPANLRGVPVTDWGFARDRITGLGHLEGRTVGVLSDGNVQDQKVVTGGAIDLDEPGVVVTVGLPYVSDFETLEINIPGAETLRLKNKLIKRVGLIVQDSRNVLAGPDFDHLTENESRGSDGSDGAIYVENALAPPRLLQDRVEMWIEGSWTSKGRVCVRQADPLPLSILGVILDTEAGEL